MGECTCHKNYTLDTLIPQVGVITDIRQETPDVKTFRVNAPEGGKLFEHMPGQCAMVCAPGISEGMFSITSSPTNKEYQEFSIKQCGILTDYLHSLEVGDEITVRGPYGNSFPVETELRGKNLLFIAGGIGLAPLRSVINYVLDNRENYGTVDIVYGSRSAEDLVQLKEIQEVWMKAEGVNVYLTIDREQDNWDGHVGFVPNYVKGIINLRGQIIPIIDIRLRMGKPSIDYTSSTCIIVLNINSVQIGIIVDAVQQVMDIDQSKISPVPVENQQELISGMVSSANSSVILFLDCEQLVQSY